MTFITSIFFFYRTFTTSTSSAKDGSLHLSVLFFIGLITFAFFMEQEIFDYSHVPGCAVLHHGRHRHGARATFAGHRFNLLLWCRRCFHILVAFITAYISLIYLVILFSHA